MVFVMISNKMQRLVKGSSVIRAMFEEGKRMAAQYGADQVYDFSIGNPSVTPPAAVGQAIRDILDQEEPLAIHGYMNNSGYEEVRQAIAEQLERREALGFSARHITMTVGAAGGLNVLLKTLLNPGDEVVVLAPFFSEYANYIDNYDGVMVVSPTDPETFQPDLVRLEQALSPRTRAIILNTPNNPTGVIYSPVTLRAMADLLEQKEKEYGTSIYVISDEPYREIVYTGEPAPYLLSYFRNGFLCYSYSKSLSLPGERIGYLAAHPQMDGLEDILAAINVATRILGFVSAPSLFQKVIGRTLDASVDLEVYRRNRDQLYTHLTGLGFSCVKPEGAFYLFPRCPIPDEAAFIQMAKELHLLLVPGSSFYGPGHFRLSYCVSPEMIQRSLPAFTELARRCGL